MRAVGEGAHPVVASGGDFGAGSGGGGRRGRSRPWTLCSFVLAALGVALGLIMSGAAAVSGDGP